MRTNRTATAAAAAAVGALALSAVGMGAAQASHGRGGMPVTALAEGGTALVQVSVGKGVRSAAPAKVTGLAGGDQRLVGIDYRTTDRALYGVGNGGGIYTLDAGKGAATKVGQLSVALAGTSFGVDFNPAANALRVVSDSGQNLRQPFATPGAATVADTTLSTPGAVPPTNPTTGVVGAAYTNNDADAATGTVLYDISTATDQLLLQSPANAGTLSAVGALGVAAEGDAGFDILSEVRGGKAVGATAYASLTVAGRPGLYTVNLVSGAASKVGDLPGGVSDIAVPIAG